MNPEILEREMPASKFGAMPPDTRERLVRIHINLNFLSLEWYPRTGATGGMPLKAGEVLMHMTHERVAYDLPPQEIADGYGWPLEHTLEMLAAARIVWGAGVDPAPVGTPVRCL